jgi:predicted NAD/FAD-binding protein
MKIAILGSGIGGLCAAWLLGRDHEVTVFEKHRSAGIGAHAITVGAGIIDVPLRVLYPAYYPTLFRLLAASGIETEPVDAAASFGDGSGSMYFRYVNHAVGRFTVPLVPASSLWDPRTRRILLDLGRYLVEARRDAARGLLAATTIGEYLHRRRYSEAFADGFLVPCFAGINTCSYADVRGYPAELIIDYFRRGFMFTRVRRALGGARAIAERLGARVTRSHFGVAVDSVRREAGGVLIRDQHGHEARFDHVVFATQANQVLRILADATERERSVLGAFRYDRVRVVMHGDASLAPPSRQCWAPVNYRVSPDFDRPMITIWVNALQESLRSGRDVFQTVHPFREPKPEHLLGAAELERPIVTLESTAALRLLEQLHGEAGRRVWFCGSFAAAGIPLLESAAASAAEVAARVARADVVSRPSGC